MQKLVHKKRMSIDMHTVEFDMYHDLWGGGGELHLEIENVTYY